jgi:hypothetical protein
LPERTKLPAKDRIAQCGPELDKDVRRLLERSRAAQGLPFHVKDPAVLARVATLLQAVLAKEVARRVA